MNFLLSIGSLALAFLIGSIPTAYVMGRTRGIDIRRMGSGNVGATNAFRILGKKWGILCLVLDIFKGWLPVTMLPIAFNPGVLSVEAWQWLIGLAAICGHMFTPWLGFRGGKGVATSLGVVLAITPVAMLMAFGLGLLIIWLTGYVSVASIAGAALLPFLIIGWHVLTHLRHWTPAPWVSVFVTLALGVAIIWKHRANIQRLREGTEKRLFGGNGHGQTGSKVGGRRGW